MCVLLGVAVGVGVVAVVGVGMCFCWKVCVCVFLCEFAKTMYKAICFFDLIHAIKKTCSLLKLTWLVLG